MRSSVPAGIAVSLMACNGIFGVDDLRYESAAGAGAATGGATNGVTTTSAGGAGASGSGSSGAGGSAITGAGGTGGTGKGGNGGDTGVPCTNRALKFDGVDDFVHVPDAAALDGFDDLTIELWLRHELQPIGNGFWDLVSHGDITGQGYFFYFDNELLRGDVYPDPAGMMAKLSTPLPLDQWIHVAMVRMGSQLILRTSTGANVLTNDKTGALADYGGPFIVGAWVDGAGSFYKGVIDELRISRVARYSASSYAPPSEPFTLDGDTVALWHFDEPSGQGVSDAAGSHDGTLGNDSGTEPADPARTDVPCIGDFL